MGKELTATIHMTQKRSILDWALTRSTGSGARLPPGEPQAPVVDRFMTTSGPVASNLTARSAQAAMLTTDRFFLSVVSRGYYIHWLLPPKLSRVVDGVRTATIPAHRQREPQGEQREAFCGEHRRMLSKGASRKVRPAHLPPVKGEEDEHVCTIFAIFQKDRWRAIFNMKFTNGFMKPLPFKMTGTAALRSILLEGDWMASIDLKDANLNIRIHHSQTKFQRYVFDGWVWEIVMLPFGNAQAPFAFTRFIRPLLQR